MSKSYTSFRVADLLCCVEVQEIQEIVAARAITPVPTAPEEILGLMNLRGRILTIIDLSSILQLQTDTPPEGGMILVMDSSRGDLGLRVDQSSDVLELNRESFEETPNTLQGKIRQRIRGAYKLQHELLLLLDLTDLSTAEA